jgi:hypothetical protein
MLFPARFWSSRHKLIRSIRGQFSGEDAKRIENEMEAMVLFSNGMD